MLEAENEMIYVIYCCCFKIAEFFYFSDAVEFYRRKIEDNKYDYHYEIKAKCKICNTTTEINSFAKVLYDIETGRIEMLCENCESSNKERERGIR